MYKFLKWYIRFVYFSKLYLNKKKTNFSDCFEDSSSHLLEDYRKIYIHLLFSPPRMGQSGGR